MVSFRPVARRKKNSFYSYTFSYFSTSLKAAFLHQKRHWKKSLKQVTNKTRIPRIVLRKKSFTPYSVKGLSYVQHSYQKALARLQHFTPLVTATITRFSLLRKDLQLAHLSRQALHWSRTLQQDFSIGLTSDLSVFWPTKEAENVQIDVKAKDGIIFAQPLFTSSKYTTVFHYQKLRRAVKPYLKKTRKTLTRWSKKTRKAWRRLTTPVFNTTSRILHSYAFQLSASLLITLTIASSAYGVYYFVFEDLPSPKDLVEKKQILTTRILDRNGETLYRIYEDENRTLIPLSDIPQHVIDATIAIEDQNYYDHWGFSVRGITRALIANSKGESVQGGSTITQQLVKNRLLTNEKTIRRKLREILLSVLVEGLYTKDEILEMYLNQVAYGGSTYGIEEAAQRYFGKSARDLTLAEGTMLAGLPQAPSIYSPFGSYPELAYRRQEEVLRRMVEDDYITADQATQASHEVLAYRANTIDIKAPHFVMYVRQILAEIYGEEIVNQGGLEVTTTLDLALQDQTQNVVTTEINNLQRLRINNGAALVTNPRTGEVLAMVGSKDYFDFQRDGQVNVTLRARQPGSSIKPLTYAMALERGRTPASIIEDTPVTFNILGSPPYSPKNYDGRFHGKVTLKQALASSYNIPAVKLLNEVGINNLIDKGEQMGISTWGDRSRFGLSLTLGGGEVLMTDMAQVYGTFANQGYTVDLNPILEVKNAEGKVLYRNTCVLEGRDCRQTKTLDPRVAYQVSEILSDNNARTPAFGANSVLHIPGQQVAVKTGTTNNLKDNWTIGYTSDRVVAVWVGNNDGQPMSYVASGITGASPIWNDIMEMLLDKNNPHAFARPDGFVKVAVCSVTGTLPCRGCPAVREEYFLPGTEPKQACSADYFKPKVVSQNSNPAQSTSTQPLRRRDGTVVQN